MDITTMTNATRKPRVLVACPQSADRPLLAAIDGIGMGSGVSASVIGGKAAVRPAVVALDPAFYATPKSSDVAYIRTGRPPV